MADLTADDVKRMRDGVRRLCEERRSDDVEHIVGPIYLSELLALLDAWEEREKEEGPRVRRLMLDAAKIAMLEKERDAAIADRDKLVEAMKRMVGLTTERDLLRKALEAAKVELTEAIRLMDVPEHLQDHLWSEAREQIVNFRAALDGEKG